MSSYGNFEFNCMYVEMNVLMAYQLTPSRMKIKTANRAEKSSIEGGRLDSKVRKQETSHLTWKNWPFCIHFSRLWKKYISVERVFRFYWTRLVYLLDASILSSLMWNQMFSKSIRRSELLPTLFFRIMLENMHYIGFTCKKNHDNHFRSF